MTELQIIVVALAVCQFLFEYYLKVLNEGHVSKLMTEQPESSKSLMDDETWAKTSKYSLSKSKFSRLQEVFGFLIFFPIFLYILPKFLKFGRLPKMIQSGGQLLLPRHYLMSCRYLVSFLIGIINLLWRKNLDLINPQKSFGLWIKSREL